MSDEVKEILFTAANIIFISAVLFICLLFFNLRGEYGQAMMEQNVAKRQMNDMRKYTPYDNRVVSGYDVIHAITSYGKDIQIYTTGAYNYLDDSNVEGTQYHTGRLYDADVYRDPEGRKLFRVYDPSVNPAGDKNSLQAWYRFDSRYYAVLAWDGDTPEAVAEAMGISTYNPLHTNIWDRLRGWDGSGTLRGKAGGAASELEKVNAVSDILSNVRPRTESAGFTVTGILFICLDTPGIPSMTDDIYKNICIH